MDFKKRFIERAKEQMQTIVLPEGLDERMIEAASRLKADKVVEPVMLGNPDEISATAEKLGVNLNGTTIVDPATSDRIDDYAQIIFEARKHKGISLDDAKELAKDPLYFGAAMVKSDDADGSVAGAVNTTAHTVRAALQIIGLEEGYSVVSSFFIMIVPGVDYGHKGAFLYGDCAVMPDPTPPQLAEIALCAADNCQVFLETEPVVAMLSFSTRCSAKHPLVDKVMEATDIVRQRNPELRVDGDIQFDAAIIPAICEKKCRDNNVIRGEANTMIFPDLNAGNIGYKITQRLTGGDAIGPVLQGLAKPANDLSRGCSAEDIYLTCALTALQAINAKNK
jgi:phosphate acetyltransferase